MRNILSIGAGKAALAFLLVALWAPGDAMAQTPAAPSEERAEIEKLVADYVGLYTMPTLDAWKTLFHPALTVSSPGPDGPIRVRDLEAFFTAQKNSFATGKKIRERLENVRIEEGRRIARVTAEFILVEEGRENRGKLGLHAAKGKEGWKIVAIIFSYDQP